MEVMMILMALSFLGISAFGLLMAACARSSQMSQEELLFFAQLADESTS